MTDSPTHDGPRSSGARRRLITLLAPAAGLLFAAACSNDSLDPSEANAEVQVLGTSDDNQEVAADGREADSACQGLDGQGRTIGYAEAGDIPFTVSVREGIQSVAATCNLNVEVLDNAFDGQTAVENAEQFATMGVDAVIEFQIDATAADSVCDALSGLPVIAIDVAHPTCAVFMGADNAAAGELAGVAAGAEADVRWDCEVDAIVSMENTAAGDVNVTRMNGGIRGVQSVCGFLNLGDFEDWDLLEAGSIITRIDTGFQDMSQAATDWIASNPQPERVIVVCINDDSCLAFEEAVAAAGREGQFLFVSSGADPSVRDTIRENPHYLGSTALFPEKYGELLIPAIIRMMDGEGVTGPLLMDHVFINADVVDIFYP